MMDQKIVRKLEQELEEAITQVIVAKMGLKKLPLLPNRQTMQMMAKAAAAVYEAAVANRYRLKPHQTVPDISLRRLRHPIEALKAIQSILSHH